MSNTGSTATAKAKAQLSPKLKEPCGLHRGFGAGEDTATATAAATCKEYQRVPRELWLSEVRTNILMDSPRQPSRRLELP